MGVIVMICVLFAEAPEVGAPLDGIRERLERRRDDDHPQPKPSPLKPHQIDDKPPKPRPVMHWLGRMGKNAADLFALPTKLELHAFIAFCLTLGTVVFGFTCGVIKTVVYLRGRKAKR
jgi:hypothetical protein